MSAPRQLQGIQYLRALAALSVVYLHVSIQIPALTPYFIRDLGLGLNFAAGVDVFFVISGFIMYVTGRHLRAVDFWQRRIIRIVPLYWILTLAIAALLSVKPGLFRTTVVNGGFLVKSLLFVPYQNPGHGGDLMPILVPGWSLNMEMMFYLVFGMLLFAPARWLLPGATAVFGLMALANATLGSALSPVARFLTDQRVLEFLLGMYVGRVYVARDPRLPRWLLLVAGTGATVLLYMQPAVVAGSPAGFVTGTVLPSTLLVYAVVAWEKHYALPQLGWFRTLGDASYSLYLGHLLALGLARVAWSLLAPGMPSTASAAGFAVFGLCLAVAAALALYRLVEQPITRFLHQRLPRTPSTR